MKEFNGRRCYELKGVNNWGQTTSRDGDDVTASLVTSVSYDDVDDQMIAPPEAVRRAIGGASRTTPPVLQEREHRSDGSGS